MDTTWCEGAAVSLYERLGFDPSKPISTFRIARAWLGADAIVRPPVYMGTASTFIYDGRRRIAIARKVPDLQAGHLVGHEIGHGLLAEIGYCDDDEEDMADLIGAALLAPAPAVWMFYRIFGPRAFAEMADQVGSSETWAALRLAEVRNIPRAVITPQKVRVRGPDNFVWGSEADVRHLAKSRATRPGVTKIRLRDDPRRIVLDVEETG